MRALLCVAIVALIGAGDLPTTNDPFHLAMTPGAEVRAPIGWTEFCNRMPHECKVWPGVPGFRVTPERWSELIAVNVGVNHLVVSRTDLDHYGVLEHWAYPDDYLGDCEDYVLLKRRMLLEAGWPSSRLLITTVSDRNGDGHAVLAVRAEGANFILDSLTDAVLLWSNADFTAYSKRQSSYDPNVWVSLRQNFYPHMAMRR